jgi:hypothetical protein
LGQRNSRERLLSEEANTISPSDESCRRRRVVYVFVFGEPSRVASSGIPVNPAVSGLSHTQALTTSLTVESLIFAALGIGVAVTTAVAGGRSPYLAQGKLARHIALALTTVAVAAGTAWWQVFMRPKYPQGFAAWSQAVGVAVAVVAQPYFAWRLALGA